MSNQKEVESQIASIDRIVRSLEDATDPVLRANAKELVEALMALHGACLERMLEIAHKTGAAGKSIIETFGRDDIVKSVLLLYGLHPVDLQTRVLQALEKTRPYLRKNGGNVTFVGIDGTGVVTLRMEGKSDGCQSSAASLKESVEQAIHEAAPDISAIVMEGYVEPTATAGFVPLASLVASGRPALQESS
jgi:Fe-S cluster biogenesis protein NfuA